MSSIITFSRMLDSVQRIVAEDYGANPVTFGTPWRPGAGPAGAGLGPDVREAHEGGLTDPSFADCEGLHRVRYERRCSKTGRAVRNGPRFGLGLPISKPALLWLSGLQNEAQSVKLRKPNFADGPFLRSL